MWRASRINNVRNYLKYLKLLLIPTIYIFLFGNSIIKIPLKQSYVVCGTCE